MYELWLYNKKKITRWLEDMNFIFSWWKQYLIHSLRSFVKYCFHHSKIKFISVLLISSISAVLLISSINESHYYVHSYRYKNHILYKLTDLNPSISKFLSFPFVFLLSHLPLLPVNMLLVDHETEKLKFIHEEWRIGESGHFSPTHFYHFTHKHSLFL